jgi:hypothetical protein
MTGNSLLYKAGRLLAEVRINFASPSTLTWRVGLGFRSAIFNEATCIKEWNPSEDEAPRVFSPDFTIWGLVASPDRHVPSDEAHLMAGDRMMGTISV